MLLLFNTLVLRKTMNYHTLLISIISNNIYFDCYSFILYYV